MSDLIPDGWAEHRQGDVADFSNGKAYKLTEWEEVGTPVIRLQNLTGSGKNYYYSNLKLPDRQYCKSGDLLYMWSATFGPHIWKGPKAIYHYHIWKITCNEIDLTKGFLYQLLGYKTAEWLNQSNGMGILHITKGGMEELKLILPPLPEQQKIAAILTSVDEVIEKTQAQIDKLKDLKTGMMQTLLLPTEHGGVGIDGKPHTEFKDSPVGRIPKGWEVVKFKDIFQSYKYGPRFSSKDYDPSGNVKTIRGTDLSSNGIIKYRQVPVAKLDSKLVEQNLLKNGDLVMITTADCGATAVFESQSIPFIASAYAIKLIPKQGLNSKYINYFMQTDDASSQVDSFIRKGTVANLPGSDVMSITLALPSINEQDKIVQILEQLDSNIYLKLESLESNSRIKKALMQDLLTGKVRVNVSSEASGH